MRRAGAKGKRGIQKPVAVRRLLAPQPLGAEIGNGAVGADYRNRFEQTLCSQHPVERISVFAGISQQGYYPPGKALGR
jgi:hypothetical protein